MGLFTTFLLILFVVSLMGIWFIVIYNKFQVLTIKINEAETDIDLILKEEYDLLNRLVNVTKGNIKDKKEFFADLENIDIDKLSPYELDQALNSSVNELYRIKELYPHLKANDAFSEIDHTLMDIEEQLVGLRKYYNNHITEYNYLLKKFPSNIVAMSTKQKELSFYSENK